MPSKSSQWLSDNFDAVAKQYSGQWVVADENGIVLNGVDAEVVHNELPNTAQKAGKLVRDYTVMMIPATTIQ